MRLLEIAKNLDCLLEGDPELEITGVASIEEAQTGDLTFLSNLKYSPKVLSTKASAIIVSLDYEKKRDIALLRHKNPYLTFAQAIELFYSAPKLAEGIHPTAVVSTSAKIGKNVSIGAHSVIGDDVVLGDDVVIYPNSTIYAGAIIGNNVLIHSNCVVREYVEIGARSILQNGVVVGGDGFGYAKQEDGSWYKIVQSGKVVIEEDVEIGSGSTIDRATVGETRIKRGAKIDNLVMVGHACVVGENTLLCGQVGLAGSTKVGRNVTLAGQVGVAGHLTIGDNVVATAQTGIPNSVEPNRLISGYPAVENRLWLKSSAIFQRLPELQKEIRELKEKVARLQAKVGQQ
ncbi:MAG: UDP-3-O-(3-hydroxymyristoyl)glucosamine N-acyltransferase [Blastocatellia bacterium]|nr:UDP-3-O-(3-hydroxymyristoyl)glucosamine N-acyltransferase [Blastocatellia bacterium]